MKIYGYARVSTRHQELARQIDMLTDMRCDSIFTEKISGTKSNRPVLNKLKTITRCGDTVMIESFSRLGRSTKDLIELVTYFEEKQVKIVSLKENFDTTTPHGKLMMTVFQAFSQFERDLIVERTKEGLKSARARGNIGGRPRISIKTREKLYELYDSNHYSINELSKLCNLGTSTVYRYIKEREKLFIN